MPGRLFRRPVTSTSPAVLRPGMLTAAAVILSGADAPAHAQWTVTNLHPAGATRSRALAVSGTQQTGFAVVGGVQVAGLWTGAAASWVNLNPAGSPGSAGTATSGTQQAGFANVNITSVRASLWSGTAASWVDLNPAGSSASFANGISGTRQVGFVQVGGVERASLWTGTAASWVDLTPAGATSSSANAISGTQQVGHASVGGVLRASLWTGTAASWIDLHPAGASSSDARGTSGTQQVGEAIVGSTQRASLWTGTAASWVDLHPVGASNSRAYATSGSHQVGIVTISGTTRASLWTGTAASWVDLSSFLTGSWQNTYALGAWTDGVRTYVAGYGFNTASGRDEALLWTHIAPAALMVADAGATGRVMLFSPVDGSLMNANFIVEPPAGGQFEFVLPKNAIQVNNQIWIADQSRDTILRFDSQGNYLSAISGGLDNIRGLAFVNGVVYVSNGGSANGAPGTNAVVMLDPSGAILGSFTAAASPFDVHPLSPTELLVSGSANNPDITRHTLAGVSQGTWHDGAISFAQQIARKSNGNVLIAGFSNGRVYEFDAAGNELGSFPAPGARGVCELQNGNIMWTGTSGVNVYNPTTAQSTVVLAAIAQYIDRIVFVPSCYPNCDGSTSTPILNVQDFACFLNAFASGSSYANCDGSTGSPVLNVQDFACFLNAFAAGCS